MVHCCGQMNARYYLFAQNHVFVMFAFSFSLIESILDGRHRG